MLIYVAPWTRNLSMAQIIFFLCFKDDFFESRRVFFIIIKSEVVNYLKTFLNEVKVASNTINEFLNHSGK